MARRRVCRSPFHESAALANLVSLYTASTQVMCPGCRDERVIPDVMSSTRGTPPGGRSLPVACFRTACTKRCCLVSRSVETLQSRLQRRPRAHFPGGDLRTKAMTDRVHSGSAESDVGWPGCCRDCEDNGSRWVDTSLPLPPTRTIYKRLHCGTLTNQATRILTLSSSDDEQ